MLHGLVTPDRESDLVVDEKHDYIFVVSNYSIIYHSIILFLYILYFDVYTFDCIS